MRHPVFTLLFVTVLANVAPAADPQPRGYSIPLVDLADETGRQVIVDREAGQYLGHPTTVMLEDQRTIIAVYPKGHGRGPIVMKRSDDGGLTWSPRLPVPENWSTSQETPTIHRVIDAEGTRRLIVFSGLYPIRMAVSEDDGRSWSPLEAIGDFGGIVTMASVERLKDGRYVALFHDDGRFIDGSGERSPTMTLYQVFSADGGLTWSAPEVIHAADEVHLCEPGLVRSPDGSTIAMLLRENRRKRNSHVMFSTDEARTWSAPRELPGALTGDRHTARYAPDGRLFISFRDTTHESPTQGDWVGWVGTWDDIAEGREGQYRVRLMDNHHRWDCAYPAVEILPDGTFVTTTYGHWTPDEQPYIVSVRFTLDELDAMNRPRGLSRHEYRQIVMGVEMRVVLFAASESVARDATRGAFERVVHLDSVLSDYRPGSELMRLCRTSGEEVDVSEDLFNALVRAKRFSSRSDGAFDVTIGPLVRLWRQARRDGVLPDQASVESTRGLVGWQNVKINSTNRTVRLALEGMQLDLGGIGKGFAADEAVNVLRRRGVGRCLVDIGGDIVAGRAPPGQTGWKVAIDAGGGVDEYVFLENAAIATSGDTEQFVEFDGVRYSHIVDPATGLGLTDRLAVTVVTQDGATADAIASAVSVMGAEQGLRFAEGYRQSHVLVRKLDTGEVNRTRNFPSLRPIFNGRDLDGWKGLVANPPTRAKMSPSELAAAQEEADEKMRAHWSVKDGLLLFDGKGTSLVAERDYADFELYVDWRIEPGGDSGLYLRGSPQVQIWENEVGSGGLYNNQKNPSKPLVVADNPPGKWNTFKVRMLGEKVSVWLNGTLIVDDVVLENYWERDKPIYESGALELQAHGNPLAFRNVLIREIGSLRD